jgi:hypothetical protein
VLAKHDAEGYCRIMAVAATSPIRWENEAPKSEVRCDLVDEHFPLLLITVAGELQPQHVLQLIRFVDQARERAAAEQVELVSICDARSAVRPSELVRGMFVDWLRHDLAQPASLGSIVITRDVIVRGVIASIKWAIARGDQIAVVGTTEEALAHARQRFSNAGLPLPNVLEE